MGARKPLWGLVTAAALSGLLSGCSVGDYYAATINADGRVQLEWCNASPDIVVESSPGDGVLHLTAAVRGVEDFVDLEEPAPGWNVTGDFDPRSDTVLTVWRAEDFAAVNGSTTTTTVGGLLGRHNDFPTEPVLEVAISDLEPGSYFLGERNISKAEWSDKCDADTIDLGGILVGALLALLCILFVVVFLVISLITAISRRRASRRRSRAARKPRTSAAQ